MESILLELISPTIVVLCLAIGGIVKHLFAKIDNKYIPLIVACSGVVLACIAGGSVTMDSIAQGIISGWASTGLHQTYKTIKGGEE